MEEKLLLESVVLAGEIMLVSGAEVFRVEETMQYMLRRSKYETQAAIVLATGIFATLDAAGKKPLTIVKRIHVRSTNVNRICRVNDLSRRFCHEEIDVETVYKELKKVEKEILYSAKMKALGTIGVSASFSFIYGGKPVDLLASGLTGVFLAIANWLVSRVRINDFCSSAFCSFVVAFSAMFIQRWILPTSSADVMIISTIMNLVPGVCFTTAIRDTLNGDYGSGTARITEAIVVALAVAAGVGVGMVCFRTFNGGSL